MIGHTQNKQTNSENNLLYLVKGSPGSGLHGDLDQGLAGSVGGLDLLGGEDESLVVGSRGNTNSLSVN